MQSLNILPVKTCQKTLVHYTYRYCFNFKTKEDCFLRTKCRKMLAVFLFCFCQMGKLKYKEHLFIKSVSNLSEKEEFLPLVWSHSAWRNRGFVSCSPHSCQASPRPTGTSVRASQARRQAAGGSASRWR